MSAQWKQKNGKKQNTATYTRRQLNNLKNLDTKAIYRRCFNLFVKAPSILRGLITKVIQFKNSAKQRKLMFRQLHRVKSGCKKILSTLTPLNSNV